jgi:hypothetical protein
MSMTDHQLLCVQERESVYMCVCMCSACLLFIITAHIDRVIISPVITADIEEVTMNSFKPYRVTDHLTSRCAGDHRSEKQITKISPIVGRKPVTSNVAGECVSYSSIVNWRKRKEPDRKEPERIYGRCLLSK